MSMPGSRSDHPRHDNWPDINFWVVRKLLNFTEDIENQTRSSVQTEAAKNAHDDLEMNSSSEILKYAAVAFMVLAVLGIVGNMIAHFALTKENKLRYFVSTLIINLITVDLLISCLYTFMIALLLIKTEAKYSDENCKVFAYVKYTGSMISMFIIIAIILNRCISIVYPKIYTIVYRNRNIWIMIAAIWLFPMILLLFPVGEIGGQLGHDVKAGSCDLLKGASYKNFLDLLIFIVSPVVIIGCYLVICFVVIARKKRWNWYPYLQNEDSSPQRSEGDLNKIQDPAHDGKDFRLLLFMFLIFTITLFCYIPHFFVKTDREAKNYFLIHVLCYLPFFFASSVKPFIYFAMCQNYRDKYKSLFIRNASFF